MSFIFRVSCAVCSRSDRIPADTQEEAWYLAERHKRWQVFRIPNTNHVEIRCPKHWAAGHHD